MPFFGNIHIKKECISSTKVLLFYNICRLSVRRFFCNFLCVLLSNLLVEKRKN